MGDTPPIAFTFAVRFIGSDDGDVARFPEVSGIASPIETAPAFEGGANRFVHQLPKPDRHPRLTLKRGIARSDSPLVAWARDALEGGLTQPLALRAVEIALVDASGATLRSWTLLDAWPQSWAIDPFQADTGDVAIETLALGYGQITRTT